MPHPRPRVLKVAPESLCQLNEMVAERVLGWRLTKRFANVAGTRNLKSKWRNVKGDAVALLQFTESIDACMEFMEMTEECKVHEKRWYYDLRHVICGGWIVDVWDERKLAWALTVTGDSPSTLLCQAALIVRGVDLP